MLKHWCHIEKFLILSRFETGRGLYKLDVPIRAQTDGHIWAQCAVLIFAFTHFRFHVLHDTDYPSLLSFCWLNYETNHVWHTRDRLQLQGRHVTISFQCSSLFKGLWSHIQRVGARWSPLVYLSNYWINMNANKEAEQVSAYTGWTFATFLPHSHDWESFLLDWKARKFDAFLRHCKKFSGAALMF